MCEKSPCINMWVIICQYSNLGESGKCSAKKSYILSPTIIVARKKMQLIINKCLTVSEILCIKLFVYQDLKNQN